MKPVSAEEYKKQQERSFEWANRLLDIQANDPRPEIKYLTNRAIIDLKQMLESSHELYKNNVAYYTRFEKGPYVTVDYDRFYNDVNGLGTALIARGLKDKRVAVIGETRYMWGVGYFATVCGTGVVVPLDKELPYEDLKNLINMAKVSAVIFDGKRKDTFVKMFEEGETGLELLISQDDREDGEKFKSQWKLIEEGQALIASGDRSFLDAQIDPEEMSILIFTSGTTGTAKGIMISHKNICTELMMSPAIIDFRSEDIFFSVLPIHHTFECTCNFIIPLYKGAAVAHCEGLRYITKNLQESHPTFFLGVPAMFEALHKAIWKGIRAQGKEETVRKLMKVSDFAKKKFHVDLTDMFFKEIKKTFGGSMRMMICGGAAINPQILDDLRSFGINAVQGYGLSETAPIGALNPEDNPKSNSVGIPIPASEARIADPGPDGIGEICLKGDNVMLGYYNNPEATAAALKDGWFFTGDLGYIDEDGFIVLTGRKKNVIITKNGKNVFPEELEYQLSQYDEIAESMVFEGESENKDDKVIVAAIYPDWKLIRERLADKADDNEAVTEYLWTIVDRINEGNPGYKMIKRILLRHTEFDKNTSRKIRRYVEENKQAN